jgi:hypothetical protein
MKNENELEIFMNKVFSVKKIIQWYFFLAFIFTYFPMDDYWLHITLYLHISDQRHRSYQLMYFWPKTNLKQLEATNVSLTIIKLQTSFFAFSVAPGYKLVYE